MMREIFSAFNMSQSVILKISQFQSKKKYYSFVLKFLESNFLKISYRGHRCKVQEVVVIRSDKCVPIRSDKWVIIRSVSR